MVLSGFEGILILKEVDFSKSILYIQINSNILHSLMLSSHLPPKAFLVICHLSLLLKLRQDLLSLMNILLIAYHLYT